MERIQMNLKRLSLTDIVIDINRVPKKKNLIEATDKAGVFSSHGDLAEDLSHISDVEVVVYLSAGLGSQAEDIWAKENCQGNSWRGADESENGGTTRGFHIGGYF
ncbi:uncharacterized protein LOC9320241 isoform X4 [Arabidopsis lyrata subsp. lyrata]|uniref:uncharacterized protein LOC9327493 isoform X4 n=1 Tax=Arabidopsis lyrata subsp. lyrata TaxID=81972 RepID=UPI000A29A670|nr:uncharacterized protein LOC9327493 isoform X4 [Arabidopsis lyrata subsp. lyrata]XP_020889472.1 uncharacterized protein LOC9320241 isoform X4 [Arabidopsis lyrata subsp. lyrata]|eukprot:XP_020868401.1 uncharacterized protein LOC9327493 isoform X4 [Arabidopsis lyrata subsp. lyrata]